MILPTSNMQVEGTTVMLLNASACTPSTEGLRLPMVLLYSVVFLVGLPANALTVWFTLCQVRRKNVLGVYLCSLSVCDLTYLFTLPLWALYIGNHHVWKWGSIACKVTGFVFYTNMYVSILLLCCISCDRYVALSYALESRGLRRQHRAVGITAAVVVAVTVAHIPVFMMREGETEHGNSKCFEPDHNPTPVVTALNYARFVLGFVVPLLVLAASNWGILRAVLASHSLQLCQKRRVAALAVTVVTLFLVCFAPYHVILLLRAVSAQLFLENKPAACGFSKSIYPPYYASLAFSTINSACNPLLYVLSSTDIRKELSMTLWGHTVASAERDDAAQTLRGRTSAI